METAAVINVNPEKLDARNFDAMLKNLSIAHLLSDRPQSLKLIFTRLSFVDPYAIASLTVYLRELAKFIPSVTISISNFHLQTYLERVGFTKVLTSANIVCEGILPVSSPYHKGSEVLLELTEINKLNGTKEIENIIRTVSKILQKTMKYPATDVANVCTTLAELCLNIVDHSDGGGYVIAQRYVDKNAKQFVKIGVADDGRGIRASLSERYPHVLARSHGFAIINSVGREFSRLPGRGLGLYKVCQISRQFNGSLDLRSGDARVHWGRSSASFASGDFLGTQVGLTFEQLMV